VQLDPPGLLEYTVEMPKVPAQLDLRDKLGIKDRLAQLVMKGLPDHKAQPEHKDHKAQPDLKAIPD
jgi:hypothetical protein